MGVADSGQSAFGNVGMFRIKNRRAVRWKFSQKGGKLEKSTYSNTFVDPHFEVTSNLRFLFTHPILFNMSYQYN